MAEWDPLYKTGTASIANGSTALTGAGTNWSTAGLRAGDQFKAAGLSVSIASINSNTSITLANSWPGTTRAADSYEILRVSDADRMIAANAALAQLLVPNLSALGGLALSGNKGIYASGASALATYDLTAFGRAMAALVGSNGSIIRATGSAGVALSAILGTVSQAAGTPNGALFERGSNANGDYWRFAGGLQVCQLRNQVLGGGGAYTWTTPAAFSGQGSIVAVAASASTAAPRFLAGLSASNNSVTFQMWTDAGAGVAAGASLLATGNWF